ncbi:HAMP domain-containing protein [Rubrivivax albus]|uniref:Signal transduction histidine-protein kinase/phosphatase MprB n=1 Tax=Rubrivivax albus TaxID=2499835 RepID=A0A437JTZ0_9BURK|nr:HAMP domain-containing protein [Rubrivivax albus]
MAFVGVAALLSAATLRGLGTLEQLLTQSRDGAARALQLSTAAERLGEQVTAMERAARQYLVLADPALERNFVAHAAEAQREVGLLSPVLPTALKTQWQDSLAALREQVREGADDTTLVDGFRALAALQQRMSEAARRHTEARNAALQQELEAGRLALGQQLLGTVALALTLALGFAWWLARPLQRVEQAIRGLGEDGLETPVHIRGPSDVQRIARRLDWLRQRLAETEADKARFLRHVSHDLKTPLAALKEGVSLLEDGTAGPLTDNQREIVRILHDHGALLQQRIEDLLRWNASAFAAQHVVRRPVELGALIQGLVDAQQLVWRAKSLRIVVQGVPLTAEVDGDLLGSALGNLLSNAIRFSPPGARVLIDVQRIGSGLRIEVTDAGPGVPADEQARVFEPFFRGRVQPVDGLPGTGIGLSIVAETVRAHGGQVSVLAPESTTAGATPGSRFRIDIPHALSD